MDSEQPSIGSSRLVLRPFRLTDAALVQSYAGDKEVASMTLNIPHPYTTTDAIEWIASHEIHWETGFGVTFAVVVRETDALAGCVGLRIKASQQHAELGYWMGKRWWGQGICTEACNLLLQFAFGNLRLHRVFAKHMLYNPASGQVMKNLGMVEEGVLRDHVHKDGVFSDVRQYGILEWEFKLPVSLGYREGSDPTAG